MAKQFSPEDFLTRAEKIQQLDFPISDDSRIIVLPNDEGIGFRFNCYKSEYLKSYIDKITFDQTVRQAHKICEKVWQNKKKLEHYDYTAELTWYLVFALLLVIISYILFLICIFSVESLGVLYGAISLMVIGALLTLYVVLKSLLGRPKFIELEKEIAIQLNEFLEKENNNVYLKKGLRWEMQPKFYWLELHIIR